MDLRNRKKIKPKKRFSFSSYDENNPVKRNKLQNFDDIPIAETGTTIKILLCDMYYFFFLGGVKKKRKAEMKAKKVIKKRKIHETSPEETLEERRKNALKNLNREVSAAPISKSSLQLPSRKRPLPDAADILIPRYKI